MQKFIAHLSPEKQGVALALTGMLAFSIFDASIKHTMHILDFSQVIFICYVMNILITGGTGVIQKKSFRPKDKRHVAVIVTLNVLEQLCFLTGLKFLPFAELFVVILATPMAVLVISAIFLKEHIHRNQAIAMTAGFLGALLVAASPLLFPSGADAGHIAVAPQAAWIGWVCACGNVLFGASRTCYFRKYAQDENPFALTMLFFTVLLLISAVQWPSMKWNFDPFMLLPLAVGCIIGNTGLFAYLKAFGKTRAPLIAATQYSQIVWALIIGYFIFHEQPTLVGLAGSALILISGYFLYIRKQPEEAASPAKT
jgi:S-adenosylmethionine uptake transporter